MIITTSPGDQTIEQSCYVCKEDPIPIMKFVTFDKNTKRNYEVLLGCSTGHVSPFVIKSNLEGKLLIQRNKSILDFIERFEKKYEEIVNFFKKNDDCKSIYDNIIRSIIEDDSIGVIINMRYLMEIHQRMTLFDLFADSSDENVEKLWSDIKGSILYNFFIGGNTYGNEEKIKRLYENTTNENKDFFKAIKLMIKNLKEIYADLGGQLHYFKKDGEEFSAKSKRTWSTNKARDVFVDFLTKASEIKKTKEESVKNG